MDLQNQVKPLERCEIQSEEWSGKGNEEIHIYKRIWERNRIF